MESEFEMKVFYDQTALKEGKIEKNSYPSDETPGQSQHSQGPEDVMEEEESILWTILIGILKIILEILFWFWCASWQNLTFATAFFPFRSNKLIYFFCQSFDRGLEMLCLNFCLNIAWRLNHSIRIMLISAIFFLICHLIWLTFIICISTQPIALDMLNTRFFLLTWFFLFWHFIDWV